MGHAVIEGDSQTTQGSASGPFSWGPVVENGDFSYGARGLIWPLLPCELSRWVWPKGDKRGPSWGMPSCFAGRPSANHTHAPGASKRVHRSDDQIRRRCEEDAQPPAECQIDPVGITGRQQTTVVQAPSKNASVWICRHASSPIGAVALTPKMRSSGPERS